jgi:hypothetical protein
VLARGRVGKHCLVATATAATAATATATATAMATTIRTIRN